MVQPESPRGATVGTRSGSLRTASLRWPPCRRARRSCISAARCTAGERTGPGEARRGLFLGYVLGWLRTEENSYLTTPIEAVREMPHQAQALLGYEAHQAIGVVDVGTPMKMLRG